MKDSTFLPWKTAVRLPQPPAWLLNLLILAAWLWLFSPLFDYLGTIFSREDFRTNQLLLLGVLALIALKIYEGWNAGLGGRDTGEEQYSARRGYFPRIPPLRYRPLPLAITLLSAIAFLLSERFLDVHTLAATLFGLGSYGLLGLWLSPRRWREGLPAALLLVGTLPFGDHMQTFIGYPMRIATAVLVRDGLAAAGVASVGVDTILVFENGVSHVDLPCSGVKSLWTGTLFLLAATWLEKRPFTLRWLLVAAAFAILLFLANLTRVAILVTVGDVWGWRLLAEMLHVPLGVLGFAAACVTAVLLLRRLPFSTKSLTIDPWQSTIDNFPRAKARGHESLPFVLIAIFSIMALAYTPKPQYGLTQSTAGWTFPATIAVSEQPLKPDEQEWLTRDGAEAADRYRFESGNLSGTMILITSKTWRAHHRPERCFEVYGLTLDESRTHLVSTQQPVRLVSLGQQDGRLPLTATYWFQSADTTTDDYATRIWADLAPQRDRWVLVSILFDEVQEPNDPETAAFYEMMHETVNRRLTNQ